MEIIIFSRNILTSKRTSEQAARQTGERQAPSEILFAASPAPFRFIIRRVGARFLRLCASAGLRRRLISFGSTKDQRRQRQANPLASFFTYWRWRRPPIAALTRKFEATTKRRLEFACSYLVRSVQLKLIMICVFGELDNYSSG